MNRVLHSLMIVAGMSAFCCAQNAAPPQNAGAATPPVASQAGAPNQIAAGTVIPAELSKSVDAKKSKQGDKVEAKVAMDMLSHGQIVIPRNTKVIGHVANTKPHTKDSPDSKVEIAFDRLLMKDGREIPFQATIQALSRPQQMVPSSSGNDPTSENPGSMPAPGGPASGGGNMGGPGRASSPQATSPTYGGSRTGQPDQSAPSSTVGALSPNSQGVVGMAGLSLSPSAEGATISSEKDNVHLDSGTQLILRATGK
jgi:hypothetical protein